MLISELWASDVKSASGQQMSSSKKFYNEVSAKREGEPIALSVHE